MAEYVPEHYTAQVMLGLARLIEAEGLAILREDQNYLAGERGIYFDFSPPLSTTRPEETFVITPYLPRSGMLAIEHTRVQFRTRHVGRHPLWVRDYLDKVKALFPDETVHTIAGHTFDRIYQQSATTWGEETRSGVLESTQNFHMRGNRYEP